MISRYSKPQMSNLWTEESKFQRWLDVELAVCEVHHSTGTIPAKALKTIKSKACFDIKGINEIEKVTNHDVIAFLTNVASYIGRDSRYVHLGLTSSDVVDTAFAMQLRDAGKILLTDVKQLQHTLRTQAVKYKKTLCMGRTHGVHAEPMTFGLKYLLWYTEFQRHEQRLLNAVAEISVGKISGAVGTYSNISPKLEDQVCRKLGLKAAPISTQILQRDRHANLMSTLALIASSIEKISVEMRNLSKTECAEVEEPFGKGQKGSSAMPHKKNPITFERLTGLARVIRGYCVTALENVALWHERDISHSSTERIIYPSATVTLDYMLQTLNQLLQNLSVYPENMQYNIIVTGKGLFFSQRLLLALVESGMTREEAYAIVQENAMNARQNRDGDFVLNCAKDKRITTHLNSERLRDIFSMAYFLRNIPAIYSRVLGSKKSNKDK